MRVALFGGTGFVESYLIDALIEAGMHFVLLVRDGSAHKVRFRDQCMTIAGDVGNQDAAAGWSGAVQLARDYRDYRCCRWQAQVYGARTGLGSVYSGGGDGMVAIVSDYSGSDSDAARRECVLRGQL